MPFVEKVEPRHFIVLPKPKVLLMINESKKEIFSVPLLATKASQLKYYRINQDFRVDREFSKRHGIVAVEFRDLKTWVIYSVYQDASLIPVYSADALECGFANLGNRLLIVRNNYRNSGGRKWLCGAKKITISLNSDVKSD